MPENHLPARSARFRHTYDNFLSNLFQVLPHHCRRHSHQRNTMSPPVPGCNHTILLPVPEEMPEMWLHTLLPTQSLQ